MALYGLHGRLCALPRKGDALADILIRASGLVTRSQGCKLYLVSRDPEDTDMVWVTEVWESKAAHDASLKSPETLALISEAIPIIAGAPGKGQELEVIGGID